MLRSQAFGGVFLFQLEKETRAEGLTYRANINTMYNRAFLLTASQHVDGLILRLRLEMVHDIRDRSRISRDW
jgi:hypothetical protein